MRVTYYANAGVLEHVPPEVEALSSEFELNVILEVSYQAWKSNLLNLPFPVLQPGIHRGEDFLIQYLPEEIWRMFSKASSISLAIFPDKLNLFGLKILGDLSNYINNQKPDAINFNGETLRSAFCSYLLKSPVLVNVHEPTSIYTKGRRAIILAKKLLYKRANHFIAHSKVSQEQMVSYGIAKMDQVTLAVMGPMFPFQAWLTETSPKQKVTKILYIGWITPRKGVDTLLDAVVAIAEKYSDVHLTIAGQPASGGIVPNAKELPNNGQIIVISRFLQNSEVATLVNEADFVVVPYKEARQSSVILTAYAFGKPVISTTVGGLKEQVDHMKTGILVPPGDVNLLQKAIEELIQNNVLRCEMEENIRKGDQPFLSWHHYQRNAVQAIKSLIDLSR